jgi:carboxyl-terminal processing protease
MTSKILPALGLVGAIAFIPATTAGMAQVDVGAVREISQFMNVLERVRAEYVDQVDDATLIRGAIDGMLSSLDPHSSFLDQRGMQAMMTQTEGNYGGLGLTVSMEDGAVKVIAATRGTPADRAGIKSGDFITHIDGRLFYGGTLDEAVDRMRGAPGTNVRITIVRPGRERPFDVTITRAIIDIPALRWEIRDGVGIINITTFLNRNTADLTRRAMADIERQLGHPPLGYIIDLRSNGGGLLEESVAVADLFLERGEVVSQRGRRRTDIERFYARPGDAAHGLPVIVLVDAGTASASEIVAAALQDHRRAIIMGERTFGKGSVQTLLPLGDGSAIRLTTARYFTPSGRSVQEGGVTPDILVPQLSDPDYRSRSRIRESDLRRHLVNEAGMQDDIIQDDGRPDPRFAATPAQLTERGITDFQLHYALQTISRLARAAPAPRIAGAPAPRRGSR